VTGYDTQRPVGRNGRLLSLQSLLASLSKGDCLTRRPVGRLSHQDGARGRLCLETGCRVDEVTRHHPLPLGPKSDGCFSS
jgi:hypothetical protein